MQVPYKPMKIGNKSCDIVQVNGIKHLTVFSLHSVLIYLIAKITYNKKLNTGWNENLMF